MPRKTAQPVAAPRVTIKREHFNLANTVGVAIIGLLVSMLGTGFVSMIVLYTNVARLTDAETRTEQALSRHLDHSIDKDAYEKRDASIQRQLNDKASRDELEVLRSEFKQQVNDTKDALRQIQQETLLSRRR